MLEYKCEREGTHFVAVEPAGTIKGCVACGVSTDKPLWVREHSCPSCGFTGDSVNRLGVKPHGIRFNTL